MATNDTVLQALARLEDNRDFGMVLEHLRVQYDAAVEMGRLSVEPILIGRAQGTQTTLREFLNLARDARKYLDKR